MMEVTVTGPVWEVAEEERSEEVAASEEVGVSVVEEEGERRPE
jgi:hypothetical protein